MSDAATRAILVAGHAVAYATSFLDGRHDARMLSANADRLFNDLLAIGDAGTNSPLDSTRLLSIVMLRASRCAIAIENGTDGPLDAARLERLQEIMVGLVEIVRMDSGALRKQLESAHR